MFVLFCFEGREGEEEGGRGEGMEEQRVRNKKEIQHKNETSITYEIISFHCLDNYVPEFYYQDHDHYHHHNCFVHDCHDHHRKRSPAYQKL